MLFRSDGPQVNELNTVPNKLLVPALAIVGLLAMIYVLIAPSLMSVIVVGIVLGIGLVTWLIWHVTSLRVAKVMVWRDTKRKDVRTLRLSEWTPPRLNMKSLLRLSLLPALLSFSAVSFVYQVMLVEISSLDQIVYLMLYSLIVLPLLPLLPAKWIISSSQVAISVPEERMPRPIYYPKEMDNLIDIFAAFNLVLTIAGVVSASSEDLSRAFGLSVAIPLLLTILLLSPSLLGTVLFFRFSFEKKVRNFIDSMKPIDTTVNIQFTAPAQVPQPHPTRPTAAFCVNCGSELSPHTRYCPRCGAAQQ